MSRAYEWHMNGDCNDQCPVCEHEDLNPDGPYCDECGEHSTVADEFDDQIGYEEQARPVRVVALDCGHDIVTELKR